MSKILTINEHLTIVCESQNTRYGFRHLASLHRDGWIAASAKECYYNRTWERYEFQTVIEKLASKLNADESKLVKEFADNYKEDNSMFNTVAMVASLGSILCQGQPAANDWKLRMIKAGLPALDVPDDWDTLEETEKETRLNKAIAELGGQA